MATKTILIPGRAGTSANGLLICPLSTAGVIKDAIGKVPYSVQSCKPGKEGRKKGRPGRPGAASHPTLYQGTCELILEEARVADRFVRLKVYDGRTWRWAHYPVRCSRYFQQRLVIRPGSNKVLYSS